VEDSTFAWHSLGSVRLRARRYEEALDAFSRGLARSPLSSPLCLGAGLAHAHLRQHERARELLGRAVAADKRHGKVSPNSFRYV